MVLVRAIKIKKPSHVEIDYKELDDKLELCVTNTKTNVTISETFYYLKTREAFHNNIKIYWLLTRMIERVSK